MNKYLFFTTISIVPIITLMEPSHSLSPCYLIDANGNQVSLNFVCDTIKVTSPTNSSDTTPPPPPTATNTPTVSPPITNTAQTSTNFGNASVIPQSETTKVAPTRRNLRLLRNQLNSTTTNP